MIKTKIGKASKYIKNNIIEKPSKFRTLVDKQIIELLEILLDTNKTHIINKSTLRLYLLSVVTDITLYLQREYKIPTNKRHNAFIDQVLFEAKCFNNVCNIKGIKFNKENFRNAVDKICKFLKKDFDNNFYN